MRHVNHKLLAAAAGALWSMLTGVAVHAEDVELFVGSGGAAPQNKPNILLILDDSGSMGSEVEAQVNYDPTTAYDGDCSADRVYWARHSWFGAPPSPPDYAECLATDDWVAKSAIVCKAALDAFAAPQGGTYTGRMAQYLAGSYGSSWSDIATSQHTALVECADDYGEHGETSGDPAVYPHNDDADQMWRSTESSWSNFSWYGWGGAGGQYTIYDGNYLNWLNGPTGPSTRIEVMQEVAVNLVNSINGVNVGLMSFSGSEGGLVRHEIADVSSARGSLVDAINALSDGGNTPLSETLHEAHQYYTGGSPIYGSGGVSGAFSGEQYASPVSGTCQKNHIVLLTDGEPTSDYSSDDAIESLIDQQGDTFAQLTGNAQCDTETYPSDFSPSGGVCLDDLAAYLHEGDLLGDDGRQNVTTHTVGFFLDLPVLEDTAARGGGDYHTADDTGSLTSALTAIVSNILETQATFVAPAVSVNAFNQTRNLDDLYFSVFQPSNSAHWPGNLKRYRLRGSDATIVDRDDERAVDPTTGFFADGAWSFWSDEADGPNVKLGGAANEIPSSRTVFTNLVSSTLTADGNRIVDANEGITDALLGTGVEGGPTRADVIDFVNGLDPADSDHDGVTDEQRFQMGDPLHSRPAAVIYGPSNDNGRLYFGTNHGYLHSIDMATGQERWAFVPKEFLGNQATLMVNGLTEDKLYGIDGNIVVQKVTDGDSEIESDEKVYLFFGLRRGGSAYYGLDVTDPANPELMWRIDEQDLPGLGQSWSAPTPARIVVDGATQNEDHLVLVIGGGYDTSQDNGFSPDSNGNAIYIVDSESGNLLWKAGNTDDADLTLDTTSRAMEYSIPAAVKTVDINSDGYSDRLYAADMGGQIWRFDLANGTAPDGENDITGGVIAQVGGAGLADPAAADLRRFYYAPDTAFVSNDELTFIHVGIGSGYRSHPNDTSIDDRFYALRDYDAFTRRTQSEYDALTPHTDADFYDISSRLDPVVPLDMAGWKLDLTGTGEKVLAEAVTVDGEVFFSTFRPGATGEGCDPSLGINAKYRVSLLNGSPTTNLDGEIDGDGDGQADDLTLEDRSTEDDGAILSETTVIFDGGEDLDGDGIGDEPRIIGCTETDCSDLDFDPSPRRTFWTQESVE